MSSALSTALQVATEAAAAVIARRSHARATGETFAHAALQLSPPSARKYSIATAPIKDMCPTKSERCSPTRRSPRNTSSKESVNYPDAQRIDNIQTHAISIL